VFGDALVPPLGAPGAWITEDVTPVPKNIYGATKTAAEDLCQLFHRNQGLACGVLRTSRFFLEEDDNNEVRESFSDDNVKANEYLYRRVDIEDVVSAHLLAAERASNLGFRKYIVSATTPFHRDDLERLRVDAPAVLRERVPDYETVYRELQWKMFPGIERVYVNERARKELNWRPRYDSSTTQWLRNGIWLAFMHQVDNGLVEAVAHIEAVAGANNIANDDVDA
jgi:nucleoside-diphosphate-sugar epimerase